MTTPHSTPKLGLPGSPGVVSVGHDLHGGHGYKNAVLDEYKIRFGTVRHPKPESSKEAVNVPIKKRKYYGQK
jgi:hypothetical protein